MINGVTRGGVKPVEWPSQISGYAPDYDDSLYEMFSPMIPLWRRSLNAMPTDAFSNTLRTNREKEPAKICIPIRPNKPTIMPFETRPTYGSKNWTNMVWARPTRLSTADLWWTSVISPRYGSKNNTTYVFLGNLGRNIKGRVRSCVVS